MKFSEVHTVLRNIGVAPVRSLGQNFLHDQNLARAIVEAAQLTDTDYVVEIGPGLGALTSFILEKGATVLAIEKDARLVRYLRERFAGNDRLEVLHLDALQFDVRVLFAQQRVKLVANLPYSVASALLIRYLEFPSPISLAVLMLQKEMAQRLAANPGTPQYGALTVRLQHDYEIALVRKAPRTVFIPRPEVDSAIIRVTPRAPSEERAIDRDFFGRVVRDGFSQRRKQLRNLLDIPTIEWKRIAAEIDIGPNARAEELSLANWVYLTNQIRSRADFGGNEAGNEMFPVVDANDNFLHTAPRRQVHANNLRHRAVHILIFNRNGEVVLQKRSRAKDRHPSLWDSSAAGHVDGAEKYEQTAKRELEEELGVRTELTEIGRLPASDATGQEFIRLYIGSHDGPFRINCEEIEWAGFFLQELVTRWISARPEEFAPGFLQCWRIYTGLQKT